MAANRSSNATMCSTSPAGASCNARAASSAAAASPASARAHRRRDLRSAPSRAAPSANCRNAPRSARRSWSLSLAYPRGSVRATASPRTRASRMTSIGEKTAVRATCSMHDDLHESDTAGRRVVCSTLCAPHRAGRRRVDGQAWARTRGWDWSLGNRSLREIDRFRPPTRLRSRPPAAAAAPTLHPITRPRPSRADLLTRRSRKAKPESEPPCEISLSGQTVTHGRAQRTPTVFVRESSVSALIAVRSMVRW